VCGTDLNHSVYITLAKDCQGAYGVWTYREPKVKDCHTQLEGPEQACRCRPACNLDLRTKDPETHVSPVFDLFVFTSVMERSTNMGHTSMYIPDRHAKVHYAVRPLYRCSRGREPEPLRYDREPIAPCK
jgi:hypothetical protein